MGKFMLVALATLLGVIGTADASKAGLKMLSSAKLKSIVLSRAKARIGSGKITVTVTGRGLMRQFRAVRGKYAITPSGARINLTKVLRGTINAKSGKIHYAPGGGGLVAAKMPR